MAKESRDFWFHDWQVKSNLMKLFLPRDTTIVIPKKSSRHSSGSAAGNKSLEQRVPKGPLGPQPVSYSPRGAARQGCRLHLLDKPREDFPELFTHRTHQATYFGSWRQALQLHRFFECPMMLRFVVQFFFAGQELESTFGTAMYSFFL